MHKFVALQSTQETSIPSPNYVVTSTLRRSLEQSVKPYISHREKACL